MTTFSKRLNVALISGLVAATLATPVMAERGGRGGHDRPNDRPHGERPDRGDRIEKVFTRIDVNENGTITLAEMTDPIPDKAAKKLARKDKDQDGLLTAEEMQKNRHGNAPDLSAIAADIVQCVSDIKETTANDDIIVPTVASFQSAEARFDAVDTSNDGFVDITELTEAMNRKANDKFSKMDADESGDVTLEEFTSAHTSHRATKQVIRQCVREITDDEAL